MANTVPLTIRERESLNRKTNDVALNTSTPPIQWVQGYEIRPPQEWIAGWNGGDGEKGARV